MNLQITPEEKEPTSLFMNVYVNSFFQIYNSRMQSFVVNMVIGIESVLSQPQRRPHRVHPPGGLK